MIVKLKFIAVFLLSITIGVAAILYMRTHDPKYGSNIIADRIIPIGYPFLSFIAGLICSINYHRGNWVPALFFPLGVLVSINGISIYYSHRISFDYFAFLLVVYWFN